jgi:hypothetical protein
MVNVENGNRFALFMSPSETGLDLNKRISYHIGVPIDEFELSCQRKIIANNSTKLSDYGIQDNSTVFVTIRVKGGQYPIEFFNDIKNIEAFKTSLNYSIPKSKRVIKKTNFEGKCENRNYPVYAKMVINPISFGQFDLLENIFHCQLCKQTIKPGFANCQWRFKRLKVKKII